MNLWLPQREEGLGVMSGTRGALAWQSGAGGLASEPATHAHPTLRRLGGRMPGSLKVGGGGGLPPGRHPVKLPLPATQEVERAQGPALRKHRPPGPLGQGPPLLEVALQGPWDPRQSKSCALPLSLDHDSQSRPGLGPRGAELGQAREGL